MYAEIIKFFGFPEAALVFLIVFVMILVRFFHVLNGRVDYLRMDYNKYKDDDFFHTTDPAYKNMPGNLFYNDD